MERRYAALIGNEFSTVAILPALCLEVFDLGPLGGKYLGRHVHRIGKLDDGLPGRFWVGVMRDGMCADDHEQAGLYVGARNGSVWGSNDGGGTWRQLVANLPDVVVVRAAAI